MKLNYSEEKKNKGKHLQKLTNIEDYKLQKNCKMQRNHIKHVGKNAG